MHVGEGFETEPVGAGRYAPSPSGDLHLGNLRTALIAWLFARSTGRQFLIRIEDLDRARDQGSALTQLEHLADLGIDWDGEPVWQTDRVGAYRALVADLTAQGLTYECYCTRKDMLQAPTAPHHPPGSYPGTCRNLTEEERVHKRAQMFPRLPAVRLRFPAPGSQVMFVDECLGETTGSIDDVVIMRGDGTYAYNFVSVVDDAWQGVDQVVRGSDLLMSTPRQIALQRLLGYPTPEYAHVPLVLGPSGERLAKRDGAVTLPELRALGQTNTDVLAMLGASLGLNAYDERVTARDLLERYDASLLPTQPWVWSPS